MLSQLHCHRANCYCTTFCYAISHNILLVNSMQNTTLLFSTNMSQSHSRHDMSSDELLCQRRSRMYRQNDDSLTPFLLCNFERGFTNESGLYFVKIAANILTRNWNSGKSWQLLCLMILLLFESCFFLVKPCFSRLYLFIVSVMLQFLCSVF